MKSNKRIKIVLSIVVPLIVVIATISLVFLSRYKKSAEQYDRAVSLMDTQNAYQAVRIFETLGDFKDSSTLKKEAEKMVKYIQAQSLLTAKKYEKALAVFHELGDFKDSPDMDEYTYNLALELLDDQESDNDLSALEIFKVLNDYKESKDYVNKFSYLLIEEDGTLIEYNDQAIITKKINTKFHRVELYFYDDEGNLIRIEEYYDKSADSYSELILTKTTLEKITTFEYDSKGNCIHETIRFPKDGTVNNVTYVYNDSNECLKEVTDFATVDYQYNSDGQLVKETTIFKEANYKDMNKTESYQYDSNGLCKRSELTYLSSGKTSHYKYKYTFDEFGNVLTKKSINIDNDTSSEQKYVYGYLYTPNK